MPGQLLRSSSSYRWAFCGASYDLEDRFPELEDSDKAREGTAAAHYVAQALLGKEPIVGEVAPNGWTIDAEMVESSRVYLDYCRGIMAAASPQALIRVETKVTMHRLIHPLNEGTPDFFSADHVRKMIHVPDFKYGHRHVEAFRNLQPLDYAAGVLEALELNERDVADWTVVLAIVQPRSFHGDGPVREWIITGAQLFQWIAWLSGRAAHAVTPGAEAVTGDHCRDCSARVHCPAFQAAVADGIEESRAPMPSTPSDAALGLQLKIIGQAMARLKSAQAGLEELAKSRLRGGARVPYWRMEPKAGRKAWKNPEEVVQLADVMGLNMRKPPMVSTVLTPDQAVKAGFPVELIDSLADRKSAIELTEVTETHAAKAFT